MVLAGMNLPGKSLRCFCAEKSEEKIHEMGKRNPQVLQNQTLYNQKKVFQIDNWNNIMQNTLPSAG